MHRARYLFGLLTLCLAIVGAWFLWSLLGSGDERPGLHLRIEFRDARGLRPGADVRYRGVTVGTVRTVGIARDGGKSVADLLLDPAGAAHARISSSFWIVSPRFSGITSGATGLDTLVRDAYVAFHTDDEGGSPLLPGSLLGGLERPPASLEPDSLEPLQHGDLLMSLLVPENHGLRPGSPVVFRGVPTGDVRAIRLADDGTFVEVQLRIMRQHRQTVTDQSEFWVARPYLTGALLTGFTLSDVGALVSPYVSYYTQPGKGVPVEDGFRVAAHSARPDLDVADVPKKALASPPPKPAAVGEPLVLVHLVYVAIEEDTFSANDDVRHEGSGVLFLDQAGRASVLTARSIVDGNYTESDTFGGDPEIAQEQIKALVPDGPVLRGHRVWVDPGGRDLAIVVLEDPPPDLRATPPETFDFAALAPVADGVAKFTVRTAGADGARGGASELAWPGGPIDLEANRGGALMQHDRVRGILGQDGIRSTTTTTVGIDVLPDDLRPRK